MAGIGGIDLDDRAGWSLELTAAERDAASRALRGWPGAGRFAAFSIGAKIAVKEWGDARWSSLLEALSARRPALGLAMIGGPNDGARSDAVARGWRGPVINLCGRLPPRQSACVIERAGIFLGHDSGPMHLAASVGTPAVSVFSTRGAPGVWFPHGPRHRVFYPGLPWSGGEPPVYRDASGEANITQIPVAPVLEACETLLPSDAA
jgi:ADP-heptose:LPS heptosyltransferase